MGRRLLDFKPKIERVEWVTTAAHTILMMLFEVAIIKAIQSGDFWRGVPIPVPRGLGLALVYATGAVVMLTVVNLALRGWRAPFAIALSRRLATDWLYSWTRNPMVLATLTWLVAVGLWLRST